MQENLYKQLSWSQMDAALITLDHCIQKCPEQLWHAKVGNLKFCQAVFHTLIFTDLYLAPGEDQAAFKAQPFHIANVAAFGNYEEFEDRAQVNVYERPLITEYLQHCRRKARDVIFGETEESLAGPTGFSWRKCTRAELHVYNTRHIQHHAAQLSLRLRLDGGVEIPWVSAGKAIA